MDLTPATLREVEFREKLRGYHPDDVDDFLEEVAVAVEALLARVRALEGGAAPVPVRYEAPAPVEVFTPPPVIDAESVTDDTLRRTLVLAQRTADLAVAEAEDAAREMLEHAQSEAARIRDEAKAKADAVVADIEGRRAGLEREIAALQSWAVQHRDRLRDALSEQVRSLDVWLSASTPPPSARAGFGRGSAATRRPVGTGPRSLAGSSRSEPAVAPPEAPVPAALDEDGARDSDSPSVSGIASDASAGTMPEPDHAEGTDPGFSTRVFRRR